MDYANGEIGRCLNLCGAADQLCKVCVFVAFAGQGRSKLLGLGGAPEALVYERELPDRIRRVIEAHADGGHRSIVGTNDSGLSSSARAGGTGTKSLEPRLSRVIVRCGKEKMCLVDWGPEAGKTPRAQATWPGRAC
jgi:hypothetical protein